MSATALHADFWIIQIHQHFKRFYPEWLRQINLRTTPKNSQALYFFRTKPQQAEETFRSSLRIVSVDMAMETGFRALTADLPEPIYPAVLTTLDKLNITDKTDEFILDLCDSIRLHHQDINPKRITPEFLHRHLNTL